VAGDWRRLHNEELHNFYPSPNIIRAIKGIRMRLVGHVARIGEMRNSYSILVRKSEAKRHSGELAVDWRIILEWILGKIGWEVVDWMHLTQDRDQWRAVVNTVMNIRAL